MSSNTITVRFRPVVSALGGLGIATNTHLGPWVGGWFDPELFAVTIAHFGHPEALGRTVAWDARIAKAILGMTVHHQLRERLAKLRKSASPADDLKATAERVRAAAEGGVALEALLEK